MLENNVVEQFRERLPAELNPYYRHLNGEYILRDLTGLRKVSGTSKDDSSILTTIANQYGMSEYTVIGNKRYHNTTLYTQFDNPVIINSLDTQEPVPFTKIMLQSHAKTAATYKIPNPYYYNVISNNPNESDIIKCIVYPIKSINMAITASNFDILGYEKSLLEDQEWSSLYSAMIDVLQVVKDRWDVEEFRYEDLYPVAHQAIVWTILLLTLLKQRVLNIKSYSAHKYHIWEYLKSHGLEDYRYVLTDKQQLFLYKNIDYILENRGTSNNLILLIYKLLDEWDVSLYSKNIQQQEVGIDINNNEQKAIHSCKLIPNIISTKVGYSNLEALRRINKNEDSYVCKTKKYEDELKALNIVTNEIQDIQNSTIEHLNITLDTERSAGIEYQDNYLFNHNKLTQVEKFTNTPHTYLPTKLLELRKEVAGSLYDTIYVKYVTEALLYYISKFNFNPVVVFNTDLTKVPVTLTLKQAIALIIYSNMRLMNRYPDSLLSFSSTDGVLDKTIVDTSHIENWIKLWPKYIADNSTPIEEKTFRINISLPFKEEFDDVPSKFLWNGMSLNTDEYIRTIPLIINIDSGGFNTELEEPMTLMSSGLKEIDFIWGNQNYTLSFDTIYGWSIKNRISNTVFLSNTRMKPYFGWRHWEDKWYDQLGVKYNLKLSTVIFDYTINHTMTPSHIPNSSNNIDHLKSTALLIDKQANELIDVYKDVVSVGSARTKSILTDIVTSRLNKTTLDIDLLDGETYAEFFAQNEFINNLVLSLEGQRKADNLIIYERFISDLLKLIYPVTTEYLSNELTVSSDRFEELKKLMTSLLSYNIAVIGTVGFDIYSATDTILHLVSDIEKIQHSTNVKLDIIEMIDKPSWKDDEELLHLGMYHKYPLGEFSFIDSMVKWNTLVERSNTYFDYSPSREHFTYVQNIINDIFRSSQNSIPVIPEVQIYHNVLLPRYNETIAEYNSKLSTINIARADFLSSYGSDIDTSWTNYNIKYFKIEQFIESIDGLTLEEMLAQSTNHLEVTVIGDITRWKQLISSGQLPLTKKWLQDYAILYGKTSITNNLSSMTDTWLTLNANLFREAWLTNVESVYLEVLSIYTQPGQDRYVSFKTQENMEYNQLNDPIFVMGTLLHSDDIGINQILSEYPVRSNYIKHRYTFDDTVPVTPDIVEMQYRVDEIDGDNIVVLDYPDDIDLTNDFWSFTYVKDGTTITPIQYPNYWIHPIQKDVNGFPLIVSN